MTVTYIQYFSLCTVNSDSESESTSVFFKWLILSRDDFLLSHFPPHNCFKEESSEPGFSYRLDALLVT